MKKELIQATNNERLRLYVMLVVFSLYTCFVVDKDLRVFYLIAFYIFVDTFVLLTLDAPKIFKKCKKWVQK